MSDSYDVMIIGAGPGGYHAAVRAAQLGLRTALVEKDRVGGRCLNYACIPAKTVLRAAEILELARNGDELGVIADNVRVDWEKVQGRRESVRDGLTGGVGSLLKKHKVDLIEGEATLTSEGDIEVGGDVHPTRNVILATGSVALSIPGIDFGGRVLDTWGAWSLSELPKSMAVVGAGASGSEIASAFARFGTDVKLIEMRDQILPAEDKDVAAVVARSFKKQGVDVMTGSPIGSVEAGESSVRFKTGDQEAEVDYLVIAGGRAADVEALGLKQLGMTVGDDGKLKVDPAQRTSVEGIYAIGDLTPGPALAHKAQEEGIVAAEAIAGHEFHPVDIDAIPGATFCHPQVASIGLTEAAAKAAGHEVQTSKFKLGGVGAGAVYDDLAGMIKLVVDPEYGEILGAHVVGNHACDMISELVAVMALEGGYQELTEIIHPHPTISEAIPEAARAIEKRAIHA